MALKFLGGSGSAPEGVRMRLQSDRLNVYWKLPSADNPAAGDVEVWLTLYSNGAIEEHVSLNSLRFEK